MWLQAFLFGLAATAVRTVELGEEDTAKPAAYRAIAQPAFVSDPYHENPDPYNFGYETKDEYGTTQTRQETGDESGTVRGNYGYYDPFGVYREVQYQADENGFRANIKTNEPSASNQNPADVTFVVEPPPPQVAAAAASPIYEGQQPPRKVVPGSGVRSQPPPRGSQRPAYDRRPAQFTESRPTVTRLVLPSSHHGHPTVAKLIPTASLTGSPQTVSKVVIPSADPFHQPLIKVVSPLKVVRPFTYKPYYLGEGQLPKDKPQFSRPAGEASTVKT